MATTIEAIILQKLAAVPFPAFATDRVTLVLAETRDALGAYLAQPQDAEARNLLNSCLWRLIETIAWARICGNEDGERPPSAAMTPAELLVTDLGHVDAALFRETAAEPDQPQHHDAAGFIPIEWLHDYLATVASNVLRAPDLETLRAQIPLKESELRDQELAAQNAIRAHHAKLGGMSESHKLLELQHKVNELLPPLCVLLVQRNLNQETYRQKQKLTEGWNRLWRCQEELVDTYYERKAVKESLNQYMHLLTAQKKVEHELAQLRAQVHAISEGARQLSPDEILVKVTAEFDLLRAALRQTNRQERDSVPQVFLEGRPQWTAARVAEALTDTLSVDERLAHAWKSGKWPRPRIVVLPGSGPAFYDKPADTIWVPILFTEEGASSFVRAVAADRLLLDLAERESFGRLESFADVRSPVDLADAFARTYETYILREAKGFRKLPTLVRKWFIAHLSKAS